MRIVVCAKQALDPDAVNNYALVGNLTMDADGRHPEVAAIPRIINKYDEQALEAALRLRDAGNECTITVVTVGALEGELQKQLQKCVAMGADEIAAIDPAGVELDCLGVATVLKAYVDSIGGADLVLCGRQAPDDDQGVVPGLLAEQLGMAMAPIARAIEASGETLTITRATPNGDEVVEGNTPALVTITNELGEPRFPAAKAKMKARKAKPTALTISDLGLSADALAPKVELLKQYVPEVQGNCEFLEGSPEEVAKQLIDKLRADSSI